nr:hypothetical protein [Clostridium sp. CM74B_53]
MEIYGGKISYASELATAISFGSAVFLFSFHENKKLRASALWRFMAEKFLMQVNLQQLSLLEVRSSCFHFMKTRSFGRPPYGDLWRKNFLCK